MSEDATSPLLARRRAVFASNLSVSYPPVEMVRGKGSKLYDADGKEYLDCVNNVACVGHAHPGVVEATCAQLAKLNTNTRYLDATRVEYAERLLALSPPGMQVVFLVCSGSEANELALRLARAYTYRQDVLVIDHAYHGNTNALVDMSPYKFQGKGGFPMKPYVHKTVMPCVYTGPYRGDVGDPGLGAAYAKHVAADIDAAADSGHPVAAFFAESVLGCGGQVVLPAGYLKAAFSAVRAGGGVCVADEVQVGFGRVGKFFAFETQGVVPDIITCGKPIGNGFPLGAVVTSRAIAESIAPMEFFNTFGGSNAACASGLAVLKAIEAERLMDNALAVGNHLLRGLKDLQRRHAAIGDVRGLGLFIGVELVESRATRKPATALAAAVARGTAKHHHVLISTDGPHSNVLKFKPPLVFSREDADRLLGALDDVLLRLQGPRSRL